MWYGVNCKKAHGGGGGIADIDTRHQLVTGQCHLYSGERRDGVIRKCDREGEGGRGRERGTCWGGALISNH